MVSAPSPPARVLVCVNDLWNVANLRLKLVERLEAEGYRVALAGPSDTALAARLCTPSAPSYPCRCARRGCVRTRRRACSCGSSACFVQSAQTCC